MSAGTADATWAAFAHSLETTEVIVCEPAGLKMIGDIGLLERLANGVSIDEHDLPGRRIYTRHDGRCVYGWLLDEEPPA